MARRFLAVLSSLCIGLAVAAYAADEKAKDKDKPEEANAIKDELTLKKEIDARKFRDFQQSLLRLAQRLEASSKPEDRERAANIRKAIELASASGVDTRFDRLITILKTSKALSYQEVKDAMEQNKMLVADIRAILVLLLSDNRDDALKAEKARITDLLKQLDRVIRDEKLNRARVEGGRVDKKDLADAERKNRANANEIAKAISKDGGKGDPKRPSDAPDAKGDGKPEGKGKDDKGDQKNEGKPNDAKGEGKGKPEAKPESKGEAKKPEAKGEGKESKPGEKGDPKGEGKPNDGKDAKGQAKSESKDGKKSDSQAKGGEKSDSKDGKKSDSQAKGQGQGQPPQGQQGDSKGDGKKDNKNEDQKQPPQNEQPDATPGKKQIQDAQGYQKKAEEEIEKEQREKASEQQSKAIEELERARKKLEEILKQLREEEIERLLAALQARCERMLQMQIEVYNGTVEVDKAFGPSPKKDDEAQRANVQKSIDLSKREFQIVEEANKAIQLLEAEGSAVAFPEVFHQVRDDMRHVERRLGKSDVHAVTQVIEQDIISTLRDMIEALKKAQQEQQAKKNPPPGQPPPTMPQDQKLIDMLAELKMIRAMQVRVNSRTKTYGDQYTGEQASVPEIQKELQNLANRQQKIFEVTNNIWRGKNK